MNFVSAEVGSADLELNQLIGFFYSDLIWISESCDADGLRRPHSDPRFLCQVICPES